MKMCSRRQIIANSPGIYSLIIYLSKKTVLKVGSLGSQTFLPGYYVYTGSALGPGGLKARLKHHFTKNNFSRRNFWHIDFLLAHKKVNLTAIVSAQTCNDLECNVNRFIKESQGVKILVPSFGASDCKKNCKSHLLFFSDTFNGNILVRKIAEAYTSLSLSVEWKYV